jgi:glycerol-3-phosphate dehydrogenase
MTFAPSNKSRAGVLQDLRDNPRTQALIIGGGINGAAVFRDLALQGVDCLLIDKDDWGSATSAAPSRLIHGGLKYLETGEFRLVAESTRERNLLLRNAPHFVHPLPSVVPIYSYLGGIVPAAKRMFGVKATLVDRGALIIEAGMALYDLFGARRRVMPLHRFALRGRVRRDFPHMNPAVTAAATYYDARVSQAERLNFELVDDGLRAHPGARAINYLAVTGFSGRRALLTEQRTGQAYQIEAQLVVNAAGPWIDQVNHALTRPTRYIGGAKGSHLILDNPALVAELNGHMIYFGGSDGRVCLVYPFFGHALLGSTDIPFDDPDSVVCDDDEAAYMLSMLKEVFPTIEVGSDQIIYRYAGVRPLPETEADKNGAVTRDHSLPRDETADGTLPIYSMIGGKWTTFRAFAAETTDAVLKTLGRARRLSTDSEPIGGGRDFPVSSDQRAAWLAKFSGDHGVAPGVAEILLNRYGAVAERIAKEAGEALREPLGSLPDYSRGEIAALARREQVVSVADLVFRRVPIAIAGRLSVDAVEEIADILRIELGWTFEEQRREVEETIATALRRHGVRLKPPRDSRASRPVDSAAPGALSARS